MTGLETRLAHPTNFWVVQSTPRMIYYICLAKNIYRDFLYSGMSVQPIHSINHATRAPRFILFVLLVVFNSIAAPLASAHSSGIDSVAINEMFVQHGVLHTATPAAVGSFVERTTVGPDREGLISDTQYFFLYQLVFTGFLYVAPESLSKWSDESKDKDRFESWKDNVSEAVWDEDEWSVNYIGHPYFGAAYYIRARERGYDRTSSFWYSTILSTTYEYGIEAMFENPSIQDLIVTPVLGSALGYYFEGLRTEIKSRQKNSGTISASDSFLLNLTDPLGYLNQYADKWFGSDVAVEFVPFFRAGPIQPQNNHIAHSSSIGLRFNIRW